MIVFLNSKSNYDKKWKALIFIKLRRMKIQNAFFKIKSIQVIKMFKKIQ